jgi:hypothetical protein
VSGHLSAAGRSNGLRCDFVALHGACEPELLARDEAARYRSALYDIAVNSRSRCDMDGGRQCGGAVVGVMRHAEAGWLASCALHFDDSDEDGCIRLREKVAR